jgi:hypothetical protein
MVGQLGCGCEKCSGEGTIHTDLKSRLYALEAILGVEMVVTGGYKCMGEGEEFKHGGDPSLPMDRRELDKSAWAVDFYPRANSCTYRWWGRRWDFREAVRPYFSLVTVHETPNGKWSLHCEL